MILLLASGAPSVCKQMSGNEPKKTRFQSSVPVDNSKWDPKDVAESLDIGFRTPRVLPAAPMALHDALRWRNASPGYQNGGTNPRKRQLWATADEAPDLFRSQTQIFPGYSKKRRLKMSKTCLNLSTVKANAPFCYWGGGVGRGAGWLLQIL